MQIDLAMQWYLRELPCMDVPRTNPRVDRLVSREAHVCSYCRPHRGENAGRKAKHGAKKRKRNRR